jgi:hypothetical protein
MDSATLTTKALVDALTDQPCRSKLMQEPSYSAQGLCKELQ